MNNPNIDQLIREADRMVHLASEEMDRPEEDVTSHLVCNNARQAILNYLLSYLHRNGITPVQPISIAGLMDQCRAADGRFDLIDITSVHCRHKVDPVDYCLDVETVGDCLKVAKLTRSISMEDTPSY